MGYPNLMRAFVKIVGCTKIIDIGTMLIKSQWCDVACVVRETVCGILCQETTLVDRIAERRLNWFGHVSRMGSERLPAKALHCYVSGKRNQGRQPKKWMDSVNEDIEAKKLNVQQAMVLVWDRNKWKHRVAASASLKRWKRAEERVYSTCRHLSLARARRR